MYTNTDKNLKITSEIKMGENSKQVNSDAGSIFVSKTISNILSEVSRIHDFSKKSSKLDFHVHSLDEEMRKIDAFKRELPHCMHLLKDAIEALEKERLELKEREKGAVMEEFISLKSDFEEGRAKSSNETSEEKNWMSTVKLWMTPVQYENNFTNKNHNSFLSSKSFEEGEGSGSENQFSLKNRGGAFVPFKRASIKEDKIRGVEVHDLSLSINHVAEVEPEPESEPVEDLCVKEAPAFIRPPLHQPHHQEQQRKQRRCWSPELHKRFVDALVQLGGPQTATPKQIRELMKVDGLTNDEVKSHLQKYRLHVRKLPSSSAGVFSWYRQDGELSKQMAGHSGSPQDHLQLRGSAKRGGDSMEEDEDLKSESHSWKGRLHGAPRLGG